MPIQDLPKLKGMLATINFPGSSATPADYELYMAQTYLSNQLGQYKENPSTEEAPKNDRIESDIRRFLNVRQECLANLPADTRKALPIWSAIESALSTKKEKPSAAEVLAGNMMADIFNSQKKNAETKSFWPTKQSVPQELKSINSNLNHYSELRGTDEDMIIHLFDLTKKRNYGNTNLIEHAIKHGWIKLLSHLQSAQFHIQGLPDEKTINALALETQHQGTVVYLIEHNLITIDKNFIQSVMTNKWDNVIDKLIEKAPPELLYQVAMSLPEPQDMLIRLIENKVNFTSVHENLITRAINGKWENVIKAFLKSPLKETIDPEKAYLAAIQKNDADMILLFIENNLPFPKTQNMKEPLLHIALINNWDKVIDALIEKKANLNMTNVLHNSNAKNYSKEPWTSQTQQYTAISEHNNYHVTPLQLAVLHRNVSAVEKLTQAGADVRGGPAQLSNERGLSTYMLILRNNTGLSDVDLKILTTLVDKDRNNKEKSVWQQEIDYIFGQQNKEALLFFAKRNLVDWNKIYPSSNSKPDKTLLSLAIEKGWHEIIDVATQQRVDLNKKQSNTIPLPLLQAVSMRDLETVKLLVEKGANINLINEHGSTPLMIACSISPASEGEKTKNTYLDIIKFLLSQPTLSMTQINQADKNALSCSGKFPEARELLDKYILEKSVDHRVPVLEEKVKTLEKIVEKQQGQVDTLEKMVEAQQRQIDALLKLLRPEAAIEGASHTTHLVQPSRSTAVSNNKEQSNQLKNTDN